MVSNKLANGAKFILSFDDYNPLNLRVANLLKKHSLVATFYIEVSGKDALDQIKEISQIGHDIGGHTLSHPPDLKAIPSVEAMAEIQSCKRIIENSTGKVCSSFAYPRGRYNADIINMVKKSGYLDARTTKVLSTDVPTDDYQMLTTLHIYDGRKEYAGRKWSDLVDEYLQATVAKRGVFHVWGHAREIDRDDQWDELNLLIAKAKLHILQ